MDAQDYFTSFILSALITFLIILIPYIVTRIVTRGRIKYKTAKTLTIIFSIISFLIFLVLFFVTESGSVSLLPIILWNSLGYIIITRKQKNNKYRLINDQEQFNTQAENAANSIPDNNSQYSAISQSINEECNKNIIFSVTEDKPKVHRKSRSQKKAKNNKAVIALTIVTAILSLTTIGITGGLIYQTKKVSDINNDLAYTIGQNQKLERELENAKNSSDLNFSDKIKLQKELFFYETYAACVNDTSPYYHKPDCEYFDDSSFYIYNVEAAQAKGYTECPYCY